MAKARQTKPNRVVRRIEHTVNGAHLIYRIVKLQKNYRLEADHIQPVTRKRISTLEAHADRLTKEYAATHPLRQFPLPLSVRQQQASRPPENPNDRRIGYLGFLNGGSTLEEHVQNAADDFETQYGCPAAACIVHPTLLPSGQVERIGGVVVRSSVTVLPNRIAVGNQAWAKELLARS